jgi:hypothetical protein
VRVSLRGCHLFCSKRRGFSEAQMHGPPLSRPALEHQNRKTFWCARLRIVSFLQARKNLALFFTRHRSQVFNQNEFVWIFHEYTSHYGLTIDELVLPATKGYAALQQIHLGRDVEAKGTWMAA